MMIRSPIEPFHVLLATSNTCRVPLHIDKSSDIPLSDMPYINAICRRFRKASPNIDTSLGRPTSRMSSVSRRGYVGAQPPHIVCPLWEETTPYQEQNQPVCSYTDAFIKPTDIHEDALHRALMVRRVQRPASTTISGRYP